MDRAPGLRIADAEPLAVVRRSGLDESHHLGLAVVVDPDGRVIESIGEPAARVYTRSATKPVQAAGMLATGVELSGVELGLATASHDGSAEATGVVAALLTRVGLDASALGCPEAWPLEPRARADSVAPRRIAMTCSGKHAGFLATAQRLGDDPARYLDPASRVQRAVMEVVDDLCGERVEHWGVDGCLAPTPALTLTGLARGVARVVASDLGIREAVVAAPWTIEGRGLPDSELVAATGWLVKTGADGVLVAGVPDGPTVAVKALDGSRRPGIPVALALLARVGAITADRARELGARVGVDPHLAPVLASR